MNLKAKAIQQAREQYAIPSKDDLEIDDNPRVSKVVEAGKLKGYWVLAWVWVAKEEL